MAGDIVRVADRYSASHRQARSDVRRVFPLTASRARLCGRALAGDCFERERFARAQQVELDVRARFVA